MKYDFELDKVTEEIRKRGADLIAIQLPDGLKNMATELSEKLEKDTGSRVLIWAGSCYGACDLPLQLKDMNVKFLIQFGHEAMNY